MTLSRLVIVFCAALLGAACAAPSSGTAVAPDDVNTHVAAAGGDLASAPEGAATAEDDPFVCKSVTPTGTRVAQRTCTRRSVLEARQRGAREVLEAVQRSGVQTGNPTQQ